MKIKAFFLAILMLSLSHFVYAAVSGTSTIGTQTTNDIVSISIVPTDDVINAGESIQFVAIAIDNEGIKKNVTYSVSDGSITSDGILTVTKAGKTFITARQGDVSAVATITVLPATPHHINIASSPTFVYGDKYTADGLFTYQVFDKYDNEIVVDQTLVKATIKKNTMGNLLGRLINSDGSNINSPYIAIIRPVLISGYISEAGQILFFERGTYTITVKYGDIVGTKEFAVIFREPYTDIKAWQDYHMGKLNLDTRIITIQYDINGGILKVIPLQGKVYDDFYNQGLMCKFYAICEGHYHILGIRQELIEQNSKKIINKAFMMLIQGVK